MFDSFLAIEPNADEAALVKRLTRMELVKSAAAADQARTTAKLEEMRRSAEADAGIPAAKRGRGLACEIALARHDSPNRGNQHLGFAKALVYEMPHTLAALTSGVLSEWRATLIVKESACLDVEDRRTLDAELCADQAALVGLGNRRIEADAKAIAYRLDPHAIVERAVRAPNERNVSLRPAPDAMTYLTALLPMTQGVAVYATLKRAADTCGDGRGSGQVVADTLVERVTGRPAEVAVPVTVNVVVSDESLFAGSTDPARVPGYGPIPAAIARRIIGAALGDKDSRATLRRLYQHPRSGALVAMESRARLFPKGLARFIDIRDDTCRTPYCDAPIRHHDHAVPDRHGGPTTAINGLGDCEACNYAKDNPGWHVSTTIDDTGTHHAEYSTPTGAHHHSQAPPLLPGSTTIDLSYIETGLGIELTKWAA